MLQILDLLACIVTDSQKVERHLRKGNFVGNPIKCLLLHPGRGHRSVTAKEIVPRLIKSTLSKFSGNSLFNFGKTEREKISSRREEIMNEIDETASVGIPCRRSKPPKFAIRAQISARFVQGPHRSLVISCLQMGIMQTRDQGYSTYQSKHRSSQNEISESW